MAGFFGAEYQALVEWLCDEWWSSSPGICIIEGFPGVGKTRVAEEVALRLHRDHGVLTAWSECPESRTGLLDDLTLVLAESFSRVGDNRLAESLNLNLVPSILAKPMILVVDEFQRSLHVGAGKPEDSFASWLLRVGGNQGRIILLSSRDVDRGRWSERFAIRRLTGLHPNEGASLLSSFLEEEGLSGEEIPLGRREEIVKWLGGFPRALHLLVTRLHFESIDDLIGLEREAWECRDREVSPDFLRRFEEELLARARSNLDVSVNRFFERLSVYRRPVDRDALQASNQGFGEVDHLRDELISRFMLLRRRQFYSMHPVLRDTVLAEMDDAVRRSAHRIAGEHYGRHFKSQQIVGPAAKLGAAFIEARYHFSQGEDIEALRLVVSKFENHIRALFGWATPVPSERVEIDERISLLLALLHEPGAKGLHYYLARLLERRGKPGDLELAVKHAKYGMGPQSPADAWLIRMRLEERFNGTEAAIAVAREGIGRISPTQSLFSLYQSCGELLARENRAPEAIELLKEGIGRISPTQSLFSLYQSCGELLARENRAPEAIELLKEGIGRIPPTQNQYKVAESAVMLSAAMRRGDWIDMLIAATGDQQLSPPQRLFAEVLRLQVDGSWNAAAEKAALIDNINPGYFAVYSQEAFSWLCAGQPDRAQSTLDRFPNDIQHGKANPATWLATFVALRRRDDAAASRLYAIFTGLSDTTGSGLSPSESDLMRIWDGPRPLSSPHPAYYFPTLPPPSLASLNQSLGARELSQCCRGRPLPELGELMAQSECQPMSLQRCDPRVISC